MRKPKSVLLRSLLKNFNLALYGENNPGNNYKTIREQNEAFQKSRREFILTGYKAALFLGAGSFISFESCNNSGSGNNQNNNVREHKDQNQSIAIIGGGIAGLHCAYVLQKAGITAHVYEADKRTGGRIYTQENILAQGITTELGAEFIDSNHEDMLNLCREFDLGLLDNEKDNVIKDTYFFHDKFYSEQEVFNEFKKIAKQVKHDRLACGVNYDTKDTERFDNIDMEHYIRSLPCSKWLHEILITACTAEFGMEASEQSSLNFISMISTDTHDGFKIFGDSDERYKIDGGNQKVIRALSDKLTGKIHTEHILVSVTTNEDKTILKFSNQKEITVDHVVLAIPFSILRNIELNIEQLTGEKLKCIKELGYGQNNKILLGFINHPWRELNPTRSGYLFNPMIQNGWDNSHMQNNNSGPGGYTIFIGGKQSIDLAAKAKINNTKDKLTGDELQKYLDELDNAFAGSKASYNGNHKAVYWSNNPFVQASYACYKTGQWTTLAGREKEAAGNIHFAGEHCSDNFQGFMNGGAETGRMAAEEIIKQLVIESDIITGVDVCELS